MVRQKDTLHRAKLALLPWLPFIFFVIVPIVLIFWSYREPHRSQLFGYLLLGLLGVFIVFVFRCRPADLSVIGSILPTVLGPTLAFLALRNANSPLKVGPVHEFVVQLAFFFAGLIGLFVFVLVKTSMRNRTQRDIVLSTVGLFVLGLLTFGAAVLSGPFLTPPSGEGPTFVWGMSFPGFSLLAVGRAILALFGVVMVTFPDLRGPEKGE